MKKFILIVPAYLFAAMPAVALAKEGAFKSTQDALDAIFNTYNTVLQVPNIYDKNVPLAELTKLSDNIAAHIMKKQGVLVGKKSSRTKTHQGNCALNGTYIDRCDNLFDLWDVHLLPKFNDLINEIKVARGTGAKPRMGWFEIDFDNIATQIKKIRDLSMLADKKKIADIMLFFVEQNLELVKKAKQDRS
jgi:hypothetical protein